MKSSIMSVIVSITVIAALLTGCAINSPKATAVPTKVIGPTDAVSGASRVVDETEFEHKVSKDNTNYMIIVSKDMVFTKDLTIESGIKTGKDGAGDTITRSLGFGSYNEDNKTVGTRYTLTVPRLIIAGKNVKFEYGIIKGDVYVTGAGFSIQDGTIDGNLYFATEELMSVFKLDNTSTVTGRTEVKTAEQ